MQKINIISCCAECSSFRKQKYKYINFCEKAKRRIDQNSENVIDQTLIGFPKWCPLDDYEKLGKNIRDFKQEIKHLLQIVKKGENSDTLAEASYYLNSLIEREKAGVGDGCET